MVPLSVLDLAPIPAGARPGDALRNARDLARHAEALGYRRFWMAEHHNMPGIAASATAVALAHVAAGTSRIRIGAGGVMLPNHAPLVIAEQFGTLAALHPGRIDLGLGRAPGTDPRTVQALRRGLAAEADDRFPADVVELLGWFRPPAPDQAVIAVPGAGEEVEVWILGSSTFGAELAAALGLPFAFAAHFAPAAMMQALALYRDRFRPSPYCSAPHTMIGLHVVAAATDAEARYLFSSYLQALLARRLGRPGPLPPPVEGFLERLDPRAQAVIEASLGIAVVGSPATVRAGLAALLAATRADELIVTAQIFDHAARRQSYALLAEAAAEVAAA